MALDTRSELYLPPAWLVAEEAVEQCTNYLQQLKQEKTFGPFRSYPFPYYQSFFQFDHPEGRTVVQLSRNAAGEHIKLFGLSAAEYHLYKTGIHYQSSPDQFPKFHLSWRSGNLDAFERGQLDCLRVYLTAEDTVFYNPLNDSKGHLRIVGSTQGRPETHLSQLPEELNGQTEILGFAVARSIDYEAKAQEILDLSKLLEFAEQVKNH